jgi:YggT family protein
MVPVSFVFPLPIFTLLVRWGIGIIIVAMLIRAFASWFGIDERFAFIRFLARLTDPFITPVRRILPRFGRFDISFLVTWFTLNTLMILLLQSMPPGW